MNGVIHSKRLLRGYRPDDLGVWKVDDLELSVRAQNRLAQACIHTLADLVYESEERLLKIPGFGLKCLNEVKGELAEYGLALTPNMEVPWMSNEERLRRENVALRAILKRMRVAHGAMVSAMKDYERLEETRANRR